MTDGRTKEVDMSVLAAASLTGNYDAGSAIVAGLIGGIAFLLVVYMGLGVGMTRMNFLHLLGSMVAPRSSRSTAYAIGLVVHLMLSAVFGLVHAGLLTAIGVSSVGSAAAWDLLIGAVHGVAVLIVLPMMLSMAHPLVRSGELDRPGVALVGYGAMTPAGSLMAHVAFGVVTGAIYAASVL
jgi:hypothetical protein